MLQDKMINMVSRQGWLDTAGDIIQPIVIKSYKAGGKEGKELKNFIHGIWLRHPLHPSITDIPIGAWTVSAILDSMELTGQKKYIKGADAAINLGILGAAGSAVTGLTDWSGTTKDRRKVGLMHGLLNITATTLYTVSAYLRRGKKHRKAAIGLAMLGYGITTLSSYIGGYLVYSKQIGVDHTATGAQYPQKFTKVLPTEKLTDNSMRCVKAIDVPILLVKKKGKIFALAETCSHLGGSLSKGKLLKNNSVRCPLHDSVFSIENGKVLEGPATEPQPTFDVRVRDGNIEVKTKK